MMRQDPPHLPSALLENPAIDALHLCLSLPLSKNSENTATMERTKIMKIRPATPDDLVGITEIYNEAILTTTATFDTEPKTMEEQRVWFGQHGGRYPILVAVEGGRGPEGEKESTQQGGEMEREGQGDEGEHQYGERVGKIGGVERVLGWASLSQWSDRCAYSDTAELSLYVKEEYRGQGIGNELMTAILEAGRGAGLHSVLARIADGNEISVKVHESAGFATVGVMREAGRKFGRLLDVLLMQIVFE